jgi:hypothetical protein
LMMRDRHFPRFGKSLETDRDGTAFVLMVLVTQSLEEWER